MRITHFLSLVLGVFLLNPICYADDMVHSGEGGELKTGPQLLTRGPGQTPKQEIPIAPSTKAGVVKQLVSKCVKVLGYLGSAVERLDAKYDLRSRRGSVHHREDFRQFFYSN